MSGSVSIPFHLLQVSFWDTSDLSVTRCIHFSDTVLTVVIWSQYLAVGSATIQLANTTNPDWRRTVADDTREDEDIEVGKLVVPSYIGWEGGRGVPFNGGLCLSSVDN